MTLIVSLVFSAVSLSVVPFIFASIIVVADDLLHGHETPNVVRRRYAYLRVVLDACLLHTAVFIAVGILTVIGSVGASVSLGVAGAGESGSILIRGVFALGDPAFAALMLFT